MEQIQLHYKKNKKYAQIIEKSMNQITTNINVNWKILTHKFLRNNWIKNWDLWKIKQNWISPYLHLLETRYWLQERIVNRGKELEMKQKTSFFSYSSHRQSYTLMNLENPSNKTCQETQKKLKKKKSHNSKREEES